MLTYHEGYTAWGTPKSSLLPSAADVRARMVARTERISWACMALSSKPKQVEKPQYVICCGFNGGGMQSTRFSIRAGRRVGRL